jgi:antirestriction protein ArdC
MTKTKQKTKATDKYQLITDQICQLLEGGVKPWQKPWHGDRNSSPFQNLITKHKYTGSNPLWCLVSNLYHGYESPYYVTFLQAKQQGWKIKEGSKSTWIRFAGTGTKEGQNEQGEATEEFFHFAKWSSIFCLDCIDDTDSEHKIADLISEITEPRPNNPDVRIDQIEQFVNNIGATIQHGGTRAYYAPNLDRIQLPEFAQFSSAELYYATELHELAHWSGHSSRLNREGIQHGNFGSEIYAFEELIAEITSAFIGRELFVGHFEQELEHHASYLYTWLKILKQDNKAFFKAVSKAQKAADYLLEKGRISLVKDESNE